LRVLAAYSLGVFRQSCGPFDIGLLIEEQVVITKIRLVHLSVKPSSANKTFLSRDSRKPAGLRENGRLPVTLVMCQLCEFSLACLTKTWSWFLLRAEREIMMHASNGETVQVESKCGGFRGVHFSQSCNSIF
jgi:hypothetical protein